MSEVAELWDFGLVYEPYPDLPGIVFWLPLCHDDDET